ncbi:hypothetical protein MKY19_02105 [Paenibacillus sp. FSL R5-0744]
MDNPEPKTIMLNYTKKDKDRTKLFFQVFAQGNTISVGLVGE